MQDSLFPFLVLQILSIRVQILTVCPIRLEDLPNPRIDFRIFHRQRHFSIHLVADLAAIEAAHNGPIFAAHVKQADFGVDAQHRWVAGARLDVDPLGVGQRADVRHRRRVAA